MLFAHFPSGEVSSRDLDTTFYCTSDQYPEYSIHMAARQPPFAITLDGGVCYQNLLFTAKGEKVRFFPPVYEHYRRKWAQRQVKELRNSLVRPVHVEGTVVALDCTETEWCYGHWMTEVLPCFHIIEQMNPGPHKLYISLGAVRKYKVEQLKMLGYKKEDVIHQDKVPCIKADRLIFVSQTRYSRWAAEYVKERFSRAAKPRRLNRRLYVSRLEIGRRTVLNECEVIQCLRGHGFQILDSLFIPFRQQVQLFSEAETVVTQMGSAVYNLWFCPPQAKVLLLHGDGEYNYSEVLVGQNVYQLSCDRYLSKSTHNHFAGATWDVVVDIGDLDKAVRDLTAK